MIRVGADSVLRGLTVPRLGTQESDPDSDDLHVMCERLEEGRGKLETYMRDNRSSLPHRPR
jgi:hypothetical protein